MKTPGNLDNENSFMLEQIQAQETRPPTGDAQQLSTSTLDDPKVLRKPIISGKKKGAPLKKAVSFIENETSSNLNNLQEKINGTNSFSYNGLASEFESPFQKSLHASPWFQRLTTILDLCGYGDLKGCKVKNFMLKYWQSQLEDLLKELESAVAKERQ
jgi:hypothetical protein